MEITERSVGDIVVLTLRGRLVLEELEADLRDTLDGLMKADRVNLVLNLQDVGYIDSAGLGFLVSKYVSVQRRGGDIKLAHVTPRVAHVLDITHLSRVFATFDSEEDAVHAFARAPAATRPR
jgi:anti-anti-sigma factor